MEDSRLLFLAVHYGLGNSSLAIMEHLLNYGVINVGPNNKTYIEQCVGNLTTVRKEMPKLVLAGFIKKTRAAEYKPTNKLEQYRGNSIKLIIHRDLYEVFDGK